MIRILAMVALGFIMHAANEFLPDGTPGSAGAITLACGYLLLTAFLAGSLFKQIGLPKLTGYLAAGIVVGPEVLALVQTEVLGTLKIFNGVAVSLIALTAGIEMHFGSMRPLLRSIGWITAIAVLGTTLLLTAAVFASQGLLPFMAGLSFTQAAAVSLVLGVTLVAQSPAVVVALRDETDAEGPLISTVMGTVVIADMVVIVMFAAASAIAQNATGGGADVMETLGTLAWELFGSIGIGLVVGVLIAAYMRSNAGSSALFVAAVSFVVAEVGQRVHLDPLLVMLAAGILIRNATRAADTLHHGIEAAALPVYVAFFAVAGATIHLGAIVTMAIPALIVIAVRSSGLVLGSRVAARMAGAPEVVKRYSGFGLLPQAGLALALGLIFARTFPQFGAQASALIFGVVALNELLAPIAFRIALIRSGEAGKRHAPPVVASEAAQPADPPPAPPASDPEPGPVA